MIYIFGNFKGSLLHCITTQKSTKIIKYKNLSYQINLHHFNMLFNLIQINLHHFNMLFNLIQINLHHFNMLFNLIQINLHHFNMLFTDLDTPVKFSPLIGEIPGIQNTLVRRNRYKRHSTVLLETYTRL